MSLYYYNIELAIKIYVKIEQWLLHQFIVINV